jgi:hypothetical protein
MDPNRRLRELRNMMANYRHRRIHADEYADSRTLDLADEIVGDLEAFDRWLSDGGPAPAAWTGDGRS